MWGPDFYTEPQESWKKKMDMAPLRDTTMQKSTGAPFRISRNSQLSKNGCHSVGANFLEQGG